MNKLNVGLLGVGRLGKLYARSLSSLISHTRLVAVADPDEEALVEVAEAHDISSRYSQPLEIFQDPQVEAVVIVSPTHTHREIVEAAAASGKPVFCEKPLSIELSDAVAMKNVVRESGIFFQMGFMRRFDRGYRSAKKGITQGLIGKPVVFKSSSRDPYRPSLEYLNPASSGGIFVDMGIHDFDLALWFFGPVTEVRSIGGVLAYPEIEPLGDIDNAIISLNFANGNLGVIDLSRNGVYGYDIRTEILGTRGTLKIGYLRETPVTVMTQNQVSHDTVPYFIERFGEAYTSQLSDFATNVLEEKPPTIPIDAGVEALRVAMAATLSYQKGTTVQLDSVTAS